MPAISTRRVDKSMKNRTTKRVQTRAGPDFYREEIGGDELIPMPTKKLLPSRFSISLRRGFDAMPLQDIRDCRARQYMAEICDCALNASITHVRFSSAIRTTSSEISAGLFGRPGFRYALPSYFRAINLLCQANSISGVTMVDTSANILRPRFLCFRC